MLASRSCAFLPCPALGFAVTVAAAVGVGFCLLQVPIEVMDTMSHVPAPYLKQLAEDREIFNALPAAVKQQVSCRIVTVTSTVCCMLNCTQAASISAN